MDFRDVPAGTPVAVGDHLVPMPALAQGDRVLAVPRRGDLLVVPAAAHAEAAAAVAEAQAAFAAMATVSHDAVSAFFDGFADRLADGAVWDEVAAANAADVARAKEAGRSTTRLVATEKMRAGMVAGLRGWATSPTLVGEVIERREAQDYVIERRRAPLGVVAFVFEGRPNVFADGAGVLRNLNTAVMRIGQDALGTAEAVDDLALRPALAAAGLPQAAVRLVRSRDRAAGQALFAMHEVRLAVARGSGPTVALLGSIAEQAGITASLHGTGGAWVYVEASASAEAVANAVRHSLDRKVCNTLNVLVLQRSAVATLGSVVAAVLAEAAAAVHAAPGAEGIVAGAAPLALEDLSREWEWEDVPECSLAVAGDLGEAVALVNTYSPHFVASIVSGRPGAFDEFYAAVDAPYVGNGFTRWVDGQWAWERPELGLTNWERGRLLGRSGILSGDDVCSVRDVFLDLTGRAPQAR